MAGMDWFRWHHGSVTDPKFQLVAKRAGASVAEVVAVWACMLEAASSAEDRGNVGNPDFEAIDCAMGLADGKTGLIYAAMMSRNLLGEDGEVSAWNKRQPRREDDTAADRKRRQREREHELAIAGVTGEKSRTVTQSHTEVTHGHDRVEKSREDKRREKTERTAPATRLPASFDPDFEFAQQSGILDVVEEAAKFRDYWTSQPGAKGRKLDWQATWRNWCRNAKPLARASPPAESFRERDDRLARERYEEATGQRRNVIDITTSTLELL